MKAFILGLLMLSWMPAYAESSSFDCGFSYEVRFNREFSNRYEAEEWCDQFDRSFCSVTGRDYNHWDSIFLRKGNYNYRSDQGYGHARGFIFNQYFRFIETNGYQRFSHGFQFNKCFS